VGFSDFSFNDDIDTMKSTMGDTIFMNTYIIIWKSKLPPIVPLSAMKAELISLNKSECELMSIRDIIQFIFGLNEIPSSKIHCDDNPAIAIAEGSRITDRNKHIRPKYFHICHLVNKKFFVIIKVPTDRQVTIIFMKALANPKFTELCESLSVFQRR
jgi:hypothetical protein